MIHPFQYRLILIFLKVFVGPRPILWSNWLLLDFMCPSSWISNPEWISCLHSFLLCAVMPKVTSSATPAFSTNRGVHCISMYTAWQPSPFDPHTCRYQTYPQALVVPRSEPGLKPDLGWARTHDLPYHSTADLPTRPFQLGRLILILLHRVPVVFLFYTVENGTFKFACVNFFPFPSFFT